MSSSDAVKLEEDKKKFDGFQRDENGVFRITDVSERKCTDAMCVIVFICFWIGMLVVAIWSATTANYDYISKGYQFDGKICGVAGELGAGLEYTHSFTPGVWLSATNDMVDLPSNASICVKACPKAEASEYEGVLFDSTSNTLKTFKGLSAYASTPFTVGTRQVCAPKNVNATGASSSSSANVSNGLQVALEGVVNGAGVIAIGAVFILLGILIFNTCMRYCGGCIVWFVVASILACLSLSGVFFLTMAGGTDVTADEKSGYQAGAAICFILAVIWAVVICISRNAIKTAILIMEETTHAVMELKAMYLLPVFKTFLVVILAVYWIAVSANLASSGTLVPVGLNATHPDGYPVPGVGKVVEKNMAFSEAVMNGFYYHFFGYLWTMQLFIALMHFAIASSVAQWYFAPRVNGKKELDSPVKTAFKLSYGKHFGTMVFGSLVVAIAEAVRMMVEYMTEQMEKQNPGNPAVKFLSCLLKCCARCIENCLKYITKNAYIFTAMFGYSFLGACYKLFSFLKDAPLTITMAQSLGGIIIKLGRGFVVVFSVVCTFALMEYVSPWNESVESPYLVLVIVFLLALVISTIFFEVFGMSMNTLIMCFIADMQMNGGKPVNCGDGMMDKMNSIQDENQKKLDAKSARKSTV